MPQYNVNERVTLSRGRLYRDFTAHVLSGEESSGLWEDGVSDLVIGTLIFAAVHPAIVFRFYVAFVFRRVPT